MGAGCTINAIVTPLSTGPQTGSLTLADTLGSASVGLAGSGTP
jgi:hypothetical protein